MRSNAQNPIRILNLHVKDSHPRQSCSEWIPRCAAIRRVVDADVRAGKKIVGVQWINRERIDGNARNAIAGSRPVCGSRIRNCGREVRDLPHALSGWSVEGKRYVSYILVIGINDGATHKSV